MKKIVFCLLGIALLAACGTKADRDQMVRDIEDHEQRLDFNTINTSDLDDSATAIVSLYRQFYGTFPNDSLAPVYMQRAADINISLGQPAEAVAIIDSIITLHPDYADLGGCWFLKGYAYETAEDYEAAREAYTYFINNYPDHYLAKDTRTTLQYLGLTPEEMFEAIMSGATDANIVME